MTYYESLTPSETGDDYDPRRTLIFTPIPISSPYSPTRNNFSEQNQFKNETDVMHNPFSKALYSKEPVYEENKILKSNIVSLKAKMKTLTNEFEVLKSCASLCVSTVKTLKKENLLLKSEIDKLMSDSEEFRPNLNSLGKVESTKSRKLLIFFENDFDTVLHEIKHYFTKKCQDIIYSGGKNLYIYIRLKKSKYEDNEKFLHFKKLIMRENGIFLILNGCAAGEIRENTFSVDSKFNSLVFEVFLVMKNGRVLDESRNFGVIQVLKKIMG